MKIPFNTPFKIYVFSIVCALIMLGAPAFGQSLGRNLVPTQFDITTPIEPSADETVIDNENGKVTLIGNANVIYGKYSITADQITIDTWVNIVEAKGNVVLWYDGSTVEGESLQYDLETREAMLYGAKTHQDSFLISEADIEISASKELTIHKGKLTTCDMAVPHFHLDAETIRIIPEERLWIYDTVLRVGDFPTFYLPYFTRSLKKSWYAYIFHPGHSSKKGAIAINKFIMHFNNLLRLNFFVDGYSEQGFGFGFRESYKGKEGSELAGTIYGYYIDQDNILHDDPGVNEERYKIAGTHWQKFGSDTTLTARYQRLSDQEFNNDYEEEEMIRGFTQDELDYERNSFINLAKTMPELNLRVTYKTRSNKFFFNNFPEEERLPQLHIEAKRSIIPNTSITYKGHLDIAKIREEQQNPVHYGDVYIEEYERVEAGGEFALPINLFDQFNIQPFASYKFTHYNNPLTKVSNEDPIKFDDESRGVASTGVETTTRWWYPWDLSWLNWKGLDTTRLVIQPSVRYEYFHSSLDLTEVKSENGTEGGFPLIDEYDLPRFTGSRVTPLLNLIVEGKNKGNVTQPILKHFLYTAYDFETEENAVTTQGGNFQTTEEGHWTDLHSDFFYYPFKWLSVSSFVRYNINLDQTRSSSHYLWFSPWAKWGLGVGHHYFQQGKDTDSEESGSLNFDWSVSDKWHLAYLHRRDFERSKSLENRLTLTRDLHDISAHLVLKEKNREDRDHEYSAYLLVSLKLPDSNRSSLKKY